MQVGAILLKYNSPSTRTTSKPIEKEEKNRKKKSRERFDFQNLVNKLTGTRGKKENGQGESSTPFPALLISSEQSPISSPRHTRKPGSCNAEHVRQENHFETLLEFRRLATFHFMSLPKMHLLRGMRRRPRSTLQNVKRRSD